jgi:predicted murein hydrolase (TIGR00659 family)
MKEAICASVFFGAALTIGAYALCAWLQKKLKWAFLNPILFSVALIIGALLLLRVSYEDYMKGAQYISYLLTPATVCLAIPLYKQLSLLKKHWKAILIGLLAGVLASAAGIVALAYLFGLTHGQFVTLLPKSITSAIGYGVSEELGGIPSITVAVIILTGITGNIIAKGLCRALRITEPAAQGLAIGASSHAIGTAKALEMGEVQGAMSSLAVVVSGLFTVVFASFLALLI